MKVAWCLGRHTATRRAARQSHHITVLRCSCDLLLQSLRGSLVIPLGYFSAQMPTNSNCLQLWYT